MTEEPHDSEPTDAPADAADSVVAEPAEPVVAPASVETAPSLDRLPHYSRSLLKIRVPVSVTLAAKKETILEIITMAPGSIIKFDKGCDELLHMVIGDQELAEGEAVKIGDKFGFRVTKMLMPEEHFVRLKRPRAG